METLKQLTGNSGCSINIVKQSNNIVVRKISKNIEYNDRLIDQTEKQICFNHPYIKTPRVFNTGQINDLFFVDMEYISGITLDQHIKTSTPKTNIKIITSIINKNINSFLYLPDKKVDKKIHNLINILNDEPLQYKKEILKVSNLGAIPLSYCHGDLSLENIIISGQEIYLIDFLDSFINSYIIDVSKIFMDLIYGWSWRNDSNIPLVKNKIILNELKKTFTKEDLNLIQYFIGLHLFRIKPYVKTQKDKNLIDQSIDHCINYLKL